MARILLVEDDRALARGLASLLKSAGFAVDHVIDGETAMEIANEEAFSLLILDVGLPGLSGFEVLKALRATGCTTPVLVLTARSARDDRILGLDLGADDYLLKPFDGLELLARVRALIRRGAGHPSPMIHVGNLEIDLSSGTASIGGQPLELRRREMAVLLSLATRAGKVVAKERLVSETFGYDDPVGTNAIEVYVTRLRKKLGPEGPVIRGLRGLGYMMESA